MRKIAIVYGSSTGNTVAAANESLCSAPMGRKDTYWESGANLVCESVIPMDAPGYEAEAC